KGKFKYTKAIMYRSVPKDLTHFDLSKFDMIVLFSPIGVKSLLESFPNIAENENIIVAGFGPATHSAINAAGIKLSIAAPAKNAPSMPAAIENFILGKEQGATIIAKPASLKKSSTKKNAGKKTKSVFTNKSKYKQMLEEKKAANAAKRRERQLEKARKEAEALRKQAEELGIPYEAPVAAETSTTIS
ncbi:MAG: uroporphyrinogen-III synthase, partial [Bacteroidales bacterium]|nr:uroporphyrinogen-III synthase [Bacteroidales bacterium]